MWEDEEDEEVIYGHRKSLRFALLRRDKIIKQLVNRSKCESLFISMRMRSSVIKYAWESNADRYVVMGPGQKFLVGSGQPFMVWV